MSSQQPPTYYFSGINYNPAYYQVSSNLSLSQANALYLKRIGITQSTALTTFTKSTILNNVYQNYPNGNTQYGDPLTFGSLSTGTNNTAIGTGTMYNIASGSNNTAIGNQSLTNNTASFNTAVGMTSLYLNTTGQQNTAVGTQSIESNLTGSQIWLSIFII
jgi:trimeric autotransporter adhesin